MTGFARLLLFLLLWLPSSVGLAAAGSAPLHVPEPLPVRGPDAPPLRVLVLASFHRDLPAQRLFEQGLDEVLRPRGSAHQLFVEYLDGARLALQQPGPLPAGWPGPALAEFLHSKYASAGIDVMIAFLPLASDFLVAQPRLLPQALRIHVEIAEERAALIRRDDPRAVVVSAHVDYGPSIAEALRLTGARHVAVVGETRDAAALMRLAMFRAAVERLRPDASIDYWLDRPLAELKARSAALPSDAVVYYLLQFSDGAGRAMAPVDVLREIARDAAVPMVSQWESLVGSGIVGGYVLSHLLMGHEAGRVALARGRPVQAATAEPAAGTGAPVLMRYVYDARELRRFGLDASALPPGSLLRYHEPSLFEQYRGQLVAVGGVFAGLLGLLLLLARSNRARRRALTELADERALLAERVAQRTAELDDRVAELAHRNEELTVMKAQLSLLANTDGLTGLANRRHFDTVLGRELRRLQRRGGCLSVVMLDVDCFKAYNDRRGHVAGDRCLQAIAQLLLASARRPTDTAARYGGEEFALVLPDTSSAGARQLAQQLLDDLDRMAMPHPASSAAPHVTLSAGVASVGGGERLMPDEVVARADEALYRAKDMGRHWVVVAQTAAAECEKGSCDTG